MGKLNLLAVFHSKDLDGLGCGNILEKFIGEIIYNLEASDLTNDLLNNINLLSYDYSDSDESILKFIKEDSKNIIIFADVTPNLNFFDKIPKDSEVFIIDHHLNKINELKLYNCHIFYREDGKYSATRLLKEMILENESDYDRQFVFNKNDKVSFLSRILTNFNTSSKYLSNIKYNMKEYFEKNSDNINLINLYDVYTWKNIQETYGNHPNLSNKVDTFKDFLKLPFKRGTFMDIMFDEARKALVYNEIVNKHMIDTHNTVSVKTFEKQFIKYHDSSNEIVVSENMNALFHFYGSLNFDLFESTLQDMIKEYETSLTLVSESLNTDKLMTYKSSNGEVVFFVTDLPYSPILREALRDLKVGDFGIFCKPSLNSNIIKMSARNVSSSKVKLDILMKKLYNGGGHVNASGGSMEMNEYSMDNVQFCGTYLEKYKYDILTKISTNLS